MRDPLLAPLAAIATGILLSRVVAFETRELLFAIAGFTALGAVCLWRHARALSLVCCLLALAFAGALLEVAHRPGPRPELDVTGREIAVLAGCIVDSPTTDPEGRQRFVLELEPGIRARATLYPREGAPRPALRYGQKVEIDARVRRTRNFQNPGAFDYAGYLARRHIYWTASASRLQTLPGTCGSPWMGFVYGLRSAALARIEKLYAGQPYEIGMMQAILIGDSTRLEKLWTENFRSTGTFHALVISGTHVAVLAGFFLFLLRICFLPESFALLLTVLAAWLYALVSGWEAPVIRSAAGMTLFLAGRLVYRERRIVNLLAAVGIGFLLLDPAQMFEASFQLSFLAVGFIAVFAVPLLGWTVAPLAANLRDLADRGFDIHLPPRVAQFRVEMRLLAETLRLWTRLPERWSLLAVSVPARLFFYLCELVMISAVVQAGLALPMAVYFHRVSVSGLSANAFVVPLMGLVVPLGFVAVFTGWSVPAHLSAGLLAASRMAVDWHARWEPAWRIPAPPLWLGCALVAALIAAGFAFAFTGRGRQVWRVSSAACVLALLAVLVWHPFPPRVERGRLELSMIDVGQAESLFLALPGGQLALVDGGGQTSFRGRAPSRLDIGEDVVAPYLWSRSIRKLDVIIISHAHEDHIGGVPALVRNFHPRELWTGAMPPSTPEWEAVRKEAIARGVRIVPLTRNQAFDYGGVRWRVLSPPADFAPRTAGNNDSLVLRLDWSGRSLLLTGDSEKQVESEILDAGILPRTEVLKVAHHGSATSSSEPFLDAAHPAFALISAGFENSYRFPSERVLERLEARGIPVLRTDLWGLITLRTDGRRYTLETARWSAAARGPEAALDRFF